MTYILSIETSTTVCSVGLHRNGELLALHEDNQRNSHGANITLFVDDVVKRGGITLSQLDAVAVGKGPGSYTGLRIGVSAAKGLCYGLTIPLIAINSLENMARHEALAQYIEPNTLLCPMIDARRMEVFYALYSADIEPVKDTEALIVDENSFSNELEGHKIVFFGDGAAKCKGVITHPNAVFVSDVFPSAKNTGLLAFEYFKNNRFEDVAYFEPFYLKEFVATVSKKG